MKINFLKLPGIIVSLVLFSACLRPSQGEQFYFASCNSCHMEDGNGLADLIPPFQPAAFENNRPRMLCAVIKGINDTATGHFMPPFKSLNDADLANVMNYIRSLKAGTSPPFTDKEVAATRQDCR
jgi:mono/diheme cytochrome c family protein